MKSFAIYDHGADFRSCDRGTFKHLITGKGENTTEAIADCLKQIPDTGILKPALDALPKQNTFHFITVRWN